MASQPQLHFFDMKGHSLYRTNRSNLRGGDFPAWAKQPRKASILQHPLLDSISESFWFHMQLSELSLHIGRIYSPLNWNTSNVSRLNQAFFCLSGLPSSREIITGGFSTLQACWPTLSAPQTLVTFVLEAHDDGWTHQVTKTTRFHNILGPGFTLGILNVKVLVLKPIPGSGHKAVVCSFPLCQKPPLTCTDHTVSSYMSTCWDKIPDLPWTTDCSSFILSPDPLDAIDKLYAACLFVTIRLFNLVTQKNPKGLANFVSSRWKVWRPSKSRTKGGLLAFTAEPPPAKTIYYCSLAKFTKARNFNSWIALPSSENFPSFQSWLQAQLLG